MKEKEDEMGAALKYNKATQEVMYKAFRAKASIAAMQAIISSDTLRTAKTDAAVNCGELPHKYIAESAVKFADALIEVLKR